MKKICYHIAMLSFVITALIGGCIMGFFLGVNKYYDSYRIPVDQKGTWSYTANKPTIYPDIPYIRSTVTRWELIQTYWKNGTQAVIYPSMENGYDDNNSGDFNPFFGSDGRLEGYVRNVSYSVVIGKLYNATFYCIDEYSTNLTIIHKNCLFNYNVSENDLPNHEYHRIYYEDFGNGLYHVICVYKEG